MLSDRERTKCGHASMLAGGARNLVTSSSRDLEYACMTKTSPALHEPRTTGITVLIFRLYVYGDCFFPATLSA